MGWIINKKEVVVMIITRKSKDHNLKFGTNIFLHGFSNEGIIDDNNSDSTGL
jgi:hypothetical protein